MDENKNPVNDNLNPTPQPTPGAVNPGFGNPVSPGVPPSNIQTSYQMPPTQPPTTVYNVTPPPTPAPSYSYIPPTPQVTVAPIQNQPIPVVVETTHKPVISSQKTDQLVFLILGLFETLLVLRLIFRLLKANPNNGFISFVYSITSPLIAPFEGIFNTGDIDQLVEVPLIIALIIYVLLALGVSKLFRALQTK